MFKRFLPLALIASLTACSHSSTTAPAAPVNPPPPAPVTAQVIEAPKPVTDYSSSITLQTFKGDHYQISAPSTFVPRQTDSIFSMVDTSNHAHMFLAYRAWDGDLSDFVLASLMGLASHGYDVQTATATQWAGMDAARINFDEETPDGKVHAWAWATVTQGHSYVYNCVALPKATDVKAIQKMCENAAASMTLVPFPAEVPTPAPAKPAHKKPGKK